LEVVRDFPAQVKQTFGFALYQAQHGGRHVQTKPLRGFGGTSVVEIVENSPDGAFRCVYAVKFKARIYVLHAFQKKSTRGIKTSQRDIEMIRQRLALAARHDKENPV
jgi:phage-related protein